MPTGSPSGIRETPDTRTYFPWLTPVIHGAGLTGDAGRDKLHRRLHGESQRRGLISPPTSSSAQGADAAADPRGADQGRKSVPLSGVPRMYGAPRIAIVGNRLSAGILTDGKETCG